jgi:hypothetical protein
LRSTRSSGRPSRPPDHNSTSGADQRKLLVVGQRRISSLSVVSFAETAHRRPDAEPVHGLSARAGRCDGSVHRALERAPMSGEGGAGTDSSSTLGARVASRRPGIARPRGSPGAASLLTAGRVARPAPGEPRGHVG